MLFEHRLHLETKTKQGFRRETRSDLRYTREYRQGDASTWHS